MGLFDNIMLVARTQMKVWLRQIVLKGVLALLKLRMLEWLRMLAWLTSKAEHSLLPAW